MIWVLSKARINPLFAVVYQSGTFIRLYHFDCAFNVMNLLPLCKTKCYFYTHLNIVILILRIPGRCNCECPSKVFHIA